MKPVVYDFLWDDQGDAGAWVQPDGGDLVLVEASICNFPVDEDDDYYEPTGEYVLASQIKLGARDGVWFDDGSPGKGPLFGSAAQAALTKLRGIERASKQVAVNEQQEALGLAPAE